MSAMIRIAAFSADFNDVVMMPCTREHEALIEADLIRVSYSTFLAAATISSVRGM